LTFIGKTNHGDQFALELIPLLKNKKILYPRGDKIVSKLPQILKQNNIQCDEIIVYNTKCKQKINKIPEKNSIIIFSSPSTIKCFLNNFKWDSSYKAISIGKTTAKYFPDFIKPIISDNTSLASCVQKAHMI